MAMLPPPPTNPITLPRQRQGRVTSKAYSIQPLPVKHTTLTRLLSGCMLSGKLQSTLMHVVIIPLLKCKSKDPADVNNYRPIAIATALSKVLGQVLLSRLGRYLWTADSQFGFKQAHGTEIAIFALKQTIDF